MILGLSFPPTATSRQSVGARSAVGLCYSVRGRLAAIKNVGGNGRFSGLSVVTVAERWENFFLLHCHELRECMKQEKRFFLNSSMPSQKRRTGKLIPDFDTFGMLLEAENFSSADLPCLRRASVRLHALFSIR